MQLHVNIIAARRRQNFTTNFARLRFTASRCRRRRRLRRSASNLSLMNDRLRHLTYDFRLDVIHKGRHDVVALL